MNGSRLVAERLPRLEFDDLKLRRLCGHGAWLSIFGLRSSVFGPNSIDHRATQQVYRLVFVIVVLNRKRMSRLDVQHLAHVQLGVRPDGLVSPRFRHHAYVGLSAHEGLPMIDDLIELGLVTHAWMQTPQPVQSGPSTGCRA